MDADRVKVVNAAPDIESIIGTVTAGRAGLSDQ
jgi:hypothetical protein